ncbi:class I SAM-dependent methyltransferase [Candidatus Acidianus copahuensis]|nr:class I SAM-dependent methyltransferase [Candidatus Acidianus copahuensis]
MKTFGKNKVDSFEEEGNLLFVSSIDYMDHFNPDRLLSDERKKFEDPEKFLPELLKTGEIVADLGCGPGYYCRVLKDYASKLYCVDKSLEMIQRARSYCQGDNVVFVNRESSDTLIPSGTVDVVILANSFHDMDRDAVYEEIKRILKKDGRVIVVDWRKDAPFGPPPQKRMCKEDYLSFFKDFKLDREFYVGPYHFGLVLTRI